MILNPHDTPLTILLAEDDVDDCEFFKKTLAEIPVLTQLTMVHDGEELMEYLYKNADHLPDVLFLDLSMPRKTGFECLSEIRGNSKLSDLLVFVFTISYPRNKDFEIEIKTTLNKMGAQEYITKNYNFEEFKQTIHTAINSVIEKNSAKRAV